MIKGTWSDDDDVGSSVQYGCDPLRMPTRKDGCSGLSDKKGAETKGVSINPAEKPAKMADDPATGLLGRITIIREMLTEMLNKLSK